MDENTLRRLAGLQVLHENPDLSKNENFLSRVEDKMEEIAQKFAEIEKFLTSTDLKKYVETQKHLYSAYDKAEIDKIIGEISRNLTSAAFDYQTLMYGISRRE